MGQTISEKIVSNHVGKKVYAGEVVVTEVDGVMATDTTAPLALKAFKEMGGNRVFDPNKFALIIDHAAPSPNERIANLHKLMRDFAKEQNSTLFEIGEGICHQIMVEKKYVKPGQIFIGADSHTPTYGALNAFACGVGSTDLAAVMLTGKIWLKVPHSIKIQCNGTLQKGVTAKDLILFLVGKVTVSGATYQAIEFCGEAFEGLSLSSRMTIANMSSEMGAKTGIVHPNGLQLDYDFVSTTPDKNANYIKSFEFDVSDLEPQVSAPESPDNVHNISNFEGTKIDYAFIGTCCNGRLEDLDIAAKILKGKKIHQDTRLIIAPASQSVLLDGISNGSIATLIEAGASLITSGCGPCVGTHQGVPADGEVVISAANRNFRGRMGNPNSNIYLGAPSTVAASALEGEITNPKKYLS
ncbi:3-isopropylmalate dehydratase large subunit [Aquimarina sp. RZ0]|uniref:3-isopropylmalate dehydratase large subunit n=1 Tax=Aquimarina sp. RZ0 TaxID=2607730 RepID=UPI0011F10FFA|nr:3-isopropylmalate dehydratase large subunit [Aquimarina sp. RZ0]KAA1244940.1 3-isopropylmalate dehydratase large subunit [Aquimarina sp. RZ0]